MNVSYRAFIISETWLPLQLAQGDRRPFLTIDLESIFCVLLCGMQCPSSCSHPQDACGWICSHGFYAPLAVLRNRLHEFLHSSYMKATWMFFFVSCRYLSDLQLRGTLPLVLRDLHALEVLQLNNNNFTGSIPVLTTATSELKYLWLHDNQLTGTLPSDYYNISKLVELRMMRNPLLCGEFDQSAFRSRVELDISGTRLGQNCPGSALLNVQQAILQISLFLVHGVSCTQLRVRGFESPRPIPIDGI